jgi:hypothetical protein
MIFVFWFFTFYLVKQEAPYGKGYINSVKKWYIFENPCGKLKIICEMGEVIDIGFRTYKR